MPKDPSATATKRHRPVLLLALAGLALVAAACSVDEDHGEHFDAPAADGARVIEVRGEELSFDPARIEIAAGEEVAIVLTAVDLEHDFVMEGVDLHVHADPGETSSSGLRVDEPGTYTAYCSVPGHREAGMTATITVTG